MRPEWGNWKIFMVIPLPVANTLLAQFFKILFKRSSWQRCHFVLQLPLCFPPMVESHVIALNEAREDAAFIFIPPLKISCGRFGYFIFRHLLKLQEKLPAAQCFSSMLRTEARYKVSFRRGNGSVRCKILITLSEALLEKWWCPKTLSENSIIHSETWILWDVPQPKLLC